MRRLRKHGGRGAADRDGAPPVLVRAAGTVLLLRPPSRGEPLEGVKHRRVLRRGQIETDWPFLRHRLDGESVRFQTLHFLQEGRQVESVSEPVLVNLGLSTSSS